MVLRLDYATFNFDAGTMSIPEIEKRLAGGQSLAWVKKGIADGSPVVSPFGLCWKENSGWAARPHRLEVSGSGCRKFEKVLPWLRCSASQHFSRLDFCFDITMPVYMWRDMLADVFEESLFSERHNKRFSITGSGEAMTIYCGSRKQSKFFRIYNKTLQDGEYTFTDNAGNDVEVPKDHYVIRYEVELKRHKLKNEWGERVYDPSPLFDQYYSDNEAIREKLRDYIVSIWRDYLPSKYLPADLDDLAVQNRNFVQLPAGGDSADMVQQLRENVRTGKQEFDGTVRYVAQHFGKYLPWVLANPLLRAQCFAACESVYGFLPFDDVDIVDHEPGWDDLEDGGDDLPPFDSCWSPIESAGQYNLDDLEVN